MRIEGQDPGKGVEVYFGEAPTEYEYVLTEKAADFPALLKALGAKSDMLSALQEQFGDQHQEGLRSFLENNEVPFEFWSRIVDYCSLSHSRRHQNAQKIQIMDLR